LGTAVDLQVVKPGDKEVLTTLFEISDGSARYEREGRRRSSGSSGGDGGGGVEEGEWSHRRWEE